MCFVENLCKIIVIVPCRENIRFDNIFTPDLEDVMAMSQNVKIEDVGLLTPPHSDMSSDSEAGSSPNSPVYDDMGRYTFKPIKCFKAPDSLTIQIVYTTSEMFFAILGRGPRAFLIGKFSDVNPEFGKFSKLIILSNVTYFMK